ncbi:ATP-dependent DNA helicase Rep [Enterobacter cloacae]|uniref:ATP-dependent DNA helicase Rep n=1 Tax=Enterobacter cloacae TaxID=550 RepID=A0A377LQU5_ENTCL|nr:ATP-dependent DNA helicase Rep [Enterobacter cloacae]
MRLNPGQQQAVEFVTGPVSGAGGGWLRQNACDHEQNRPPDPRLRLSGPHIAAVTFTNKAAREMKERVGQTLGRKEARGLMISTFHTLGLDIIKREYAALGMKSNFSLFDDTDQVALLKELTEGLIEDDKVLLQQLILDDLQLEKRSDDPRSGGGKRQR